MTVGSRSIDSSSHEIVFFVTALFAVLVSGHRPIRLSLSHVLSSQYDRVMFSHLQCPMIISILSVLQVWPVVIRSGEKTSSIPAPKLGTMGDLVVWWLRFYEAYMSPPYDRPLQRAVDSLPFAGGILGRWTALWHWARLLFCVALNLQPFHYLCQWKVVSILSYIISIHSGNKLVAGHSHNLLICRSIHEPSVNIFIMFSAVLIIIKCSAAHILINVSYIFYKNIKTENLMSLPSRTHTRQAVIVGGEVGQPSPLGYSRAAMNLLSFTANADPGAPTQQLRCVLSTAWIVYCISAMFILLYCMSASYAPVAASAYRTFWLLS